MARRTRYASLNRRRAVLTLRLGMILILSLNVAGQESGVRRGAAFDPLHREYQVVKGDALHNAFQEMKLLRPASLGSSALIWSSIGPAPIANECCLLTTQAGRVLALAVDPRDPKTVYLAASEGGVWKTVNGGATWTALTDSQPSLVASAIALDPANPDTVYVGTGDPYKFTYSGLGLLKSTDGGRTWQEIAAQFKGPFAPTIGGAVFGSIFVHPGDSNILLGTVSLADQRFHTGVFRSADAGKTWSLVLAGETGAPPGQVLFDAASPNNIYAALGNFGSTSGVFRSADRGLTWTAANGTGASSLPLGQAGIIFLGGDPSHSGTLYASLSSSASFSGHVLGVFKTTDGGNTWSQLGNAPDYCNGQCWFDNVVAVHPADPKALFLAGKEFTWRSTDGGNSWKEISYGPHGDYHAIAFSSDSRKLYIASDGGVWVSEDSLADSVHWTDLNRALSVTQVYNGFSVHPFDPGTVLAGTWDNGVVLYTGHTTWRYVAPGDCGWAIIDPVTPSTMYASCAGPIKSTGGGAINTWNAADSGISFGPYYGPPLLVMDPADSKTLYFGNTRVYRSIDGATSWLPISDNLTGSQTSPAGTPAGFSSLAITPVIPKTLFAGTNLGTIFSGIESDSGFTWKLKSNTLPGRPVTRVIADQQHAGTLYATFAGFTFGTDKAGHVFKTIDMGETWADISGNLPNLPANDLALDPDLANSLYLATDLGVFATSDNGNTWAVIGEGLPHTAVTGLQFERASRTLYAATYGRSLWLLQLPNGRPLLNRMVSAADYRGGAVSPGQMVTLFGVNLGPDEILLGLPDENGIYPSLLSDTQAVFNGKLAPLVFVSGTVIAAMVPFGIESSSTVTVKIIHGGFTSNSITLAVVPAAPALFTSDSSGIGQAAVLNGDLSVNSPTNPAKRGSVVVLYGTGAGQSDPAGSDGTVMPLVTSKLRLPVAVFIGGMQAMTNYAGAAPGLIAGVFQINVVIPETAPTGSVPVKVHLGSAGQYSTPGLTINNPSVVTISIK